MNAEIEREVARRRTFAIISHPDAGKTTLTEKLLLYAGAIELAGAVRSGSQLSMTSGGVTVMRQSACDGDSGVAAARTPSHQPHRHL